MHSHNGKRRPVLLRGGFAALGAALIVAAAGGSASAAPTETVLYSFCSKPGCSDGAQSFAGLIADSAGNLYGTTRVGGAAGRGVVFKLSPSGTETVLHSFTGGVPVAGLIADSKGNLYGTTFRGGAKDSANQGSVFKLSPGGAKRTLYSFCSLPSCSDGAEPLAGLIADGAGNLYGTTGGGGAAGRGVVFKLSPSGTETVLHSFCSKPNCTDGSTPLAGLIADSAGNLYGTTDVGRAPGECGAAMVGCGTVFKLSPSGTETVLYYFCSKPGCSDGVQPFAGLIADSAGNLYGTTFDGGAGCFGVGCGVVFKLSPGGAYMVLHTFCSLPSCSDGAGPLAGLIADSSGNLYGTTNRGGASGFGVMFKLSPPIPPATKWTETVLHSFCSKPNCTDGSLPVAGLIADSAGNLYGTTFGGGAAGSVCGAEGYGSEGCGVVFKLAGTGFAVPLPASGP